MFIVTEDRDFRFTDVYRGYILPEPQGKLNISAALESPDGPSVVVFAGITDEGEILTDYETIVPKNRGKYYFASRKVFTGEYADKYVSAYNLLGCRTIYVLWVWEMPDGEISGMLLGIPWDGIRKIYNGEAIDADLNDYCLLEVSNSLKTSKHMEMDVPYVEGRMPIEVWADIERRNGVSRFEVWPNGNCNDIFRLAVGIQEQCEPIKGRMWKNIAYEEFGCCIYDRLLDVEKILNDAEMNAHGR